MIIDENISGTKLLNSSSGLLHNDQFDISEEFGSIVLFFEDSTKQLNFTLESTSIWSTLTENVNTFSHSTKNHC